MAAFFLRRRRKLPGTSKVDPRTLRAVTLSGRRYLNASYVLPKDMSEVSRLDFQHYIYRQVLRGSYTVPLNNPQRILDVACGTGIWGKELAKQFPSAQVTGIDLENMQSTSNLAPNLVPPNYSFMQGNILEPLAFPDNIFDFVHMRLILGSAIPVKMWVTLFRELLRVLRPGGWLELAEMGVDGVNLGPITLQFFQWGIDAALPRGIDARQIPRIDRYLTEAGGVNIKGRYADVPLGAWGGRVGSLMYTNLMDALAGLKPLYLERGATASSFDTLHLQLGEEWMHSRSSMRFFIFTCQKG